MLVNICFTKLSFLTWFILKDKEALFCLTKNEVTERLIWSR